MLFAMKSSRTVYILFFLIAVLGVGVFLSRDTPLMSSSTTATLDPVIVEEGTATMLDGIQYVDITARAGYSPRTTYAQAGIPAVIRVHTSDTYDCSSTLVIPALRYESTLAATGVVEIPVSAEQAQGTLEGMCGMNMYQFSIVFS
jgi:Cupredoxin-like domain